MTRGPARDRVGSPGSVIHDKRDAEDLVVRDDAHLGEAVGALHVSVVAGEDDNRILARSLGRQRIEDATDVIVEAGDHCTVLVPHLADFLPGEITLGVAGQLRVERGRITQVVAEGLREGNTAAFVPVCEAWVLVESRVWEVERDGREERVVAGAVCEVLDGPVGGRRVPRCSFRWVRGLVDVGSDPQPKSVTLPSPRCHLPT